MNMCDFRCTLRFDTVREAISNWLSSPRLELNLSCSHPVPRYDRWSNGKMAIEDWLYLSVIPLIQDFNVNGFHKWPFLSVQMWGEDPRGTWVLMVESVTTNPNLAGMILPYPSILTPIVNHELTLPRNLPWLDSPTLRNCRSGPSGG